MSGRITTNTLRALSIDQVDAANSGHPGAPLGLATSMLALTKHMVWHPTWQNRDRFILSNGHACALLYSWLHLMGVLELNDLKQFRKVDSKTPGHPESHNTGVEVCTGPLGQGIAQAVGLAAAQEHLAATFNKPGFELFTNYTFVICGDGCLQEGVASEAASLAGHLKLGKLIVLYDDNKITIDGDTSLSFTEDVNARFKAYGWHTDMVENGTEDFDAVYKAIQKAKLVKDKPSLINVKTIIGFGSPLAGSEKVHGSALGAEKNKATKKALGLDPEKSFNVPQEALDEFMAYRKIGQDAKQKWDALLKDYNTKHPELYTQLTRRLNKQLPSDYHSFFPTFDISKCEATRKNSQTILNAICSKIPEIVGGSADLTPSTLTKWNDSVDFQPASYHGRYFRFGVREHAMAAFVNGLYAYGLLIPFGSTFLNFLGYAQGGFRLGALSQFKVFYVMTHDSIGLGEDGPTHQPIEILPLVRSTPNCLLIRPADGNETSAAYIAALEHQGPTVLSLSRHAVKGLQGSSIDKALKGAYVVETPSHQSTPTLVLVGTGTEVSICVDAAELMDGTVRVVSMPCWELFDKQSKDYKIEIFPMGVPVLSVEASSPYGWSKYANASHGMTTFGASGSQPDVYEKFGFTPQVIAKKGKQLVDYFKSRHVPHFTENPLI